MRAISLVLGAVGVTLGAGAVVFRPAPPPPADTSADTSAPAAISAGDLVLTELMIWPQDGPDGSTGTSDEWIEVTNPTGADLDLMGCTLTLDDKTVDIDTSVVIPAGGRGILFRQTDSNKDFDAVDLAGDAPALFRYTGLDMVISRAQTLTLSCGAVIDSVVFDFTDFKELCSDRMDESGATGGCTLSLKPDSTDAAANDDAATLGGAWGVPPTSASYTNHRSAATLGTPDEVNTVEDPVVESEPPDDSGLPDDTGTGSTVEVPDDVCRAGQVIFTELMPAPKNSNNDEWIEIKGLTDCDLQSCTVSVVEEGEQFQVDRSVPVTTGAYMVLANASSSEAAVGISWVDNDDGSVTDAAYLWHYNDVTLPSDGPYTLRLSCDGDVVDEIPFDWTQAQRPAICDDINCSVNLRDSSESTDGNDNLSSWCVAPEDGNLWTYTPPLGDGDTAEEPTTVLGTPGHSGACLEIPWPTEGEVVFTELMASPQGTNEWLEMTSVTSRDVELTLCTLKRHRLDEAGAETDAVTYLFGEDDTTVPMASGVVQVFADGGCILEDEGGGDTGDTAAATACTWGELPYGGSLSFTTDQTEYVSLICPDAEGGPDVTVDQFSYNMQYQNVEHGHSLMFLPGEYATAGTDNDDTSAWCEAGYSQNFCELTDEDCNYGTPGTLDDCASTVDYPDGHVCRCASASPRAAWAPLLGVLLAWGRRRSRRG